MKELSEYVGIGAGVFSGCSPIIITNNFSFMVNIIIIFFSAKYEP